MIDKYAIVIIGPATKEYLVRQGGRLCVMSTNNRLYPVSELKRLTPYFKGLPVFHEHQATPSRWGGPIGSITSSYWDAGRRSICGVFNVTNGRWIDKFQYGRPLSEWGFSVMWDCDAWEFHPSGYSEPFHVCENITRPYSVDLVEMGAAGGRFDVPLSAERLNDYKMFYPR